MYEVYRAQIGEHAPFSVESGIQAVKRWGEQGTQLLGEYKNLKTAKNKADTAEVDQLVIYKSRWWGERLSGSIVVVVENNKVIYKRPHGEIIDKRP